MKILSGTSNPTLSKSISKHLKTKLVNTNIKKFADGEIYVEINENIRGNSVFVIQSTSTPANDNLMELLLVIDALRRSNASQALILMIRLYIVEQAAINVQVFNKFDLAFMDSNIFSSNIMSLMAKDMSAYKQSFEAVNVNLYQELLGGSF